MSLNGETTKDTYIKLLLINNDHREDEVVGLDESYAVVDITDSVLEKVKNFGGHCILGVTYRNNKNSQSWMPLFYEYPLLDKIEWEVNRIFDACIVNEKQKKAVKEIFAVRLRGAFESEARTLDLARRIVEE